MEKKSFYELSFDDLYIESSDSAFPYLKRVLTVSFFRAISSIKRIMNQHTPLKRLHSRQKINQ